MIRNSEIHNKISDGLFWSFAERISAQLVSTVVGIILARMLTPDEYGLISIVMIFITICNVFVVSGFGTALARKMEADSIDFNTAFYLSFFISIFLYILLFCFAPIISDFYQIELLTPVIRILGIRLIITSLNTIQQAKVQRDMTFRKFFVSTLCGTVFSCIAGIIMAYKGYGVWALVTQYMLNTSIDTIILLFTCGWKPELQFSITRAADIFKFGIKVLGADLIITCQTEMRSFIVGKQFGASELAYLEQGKKYVALFVNNIDASISKVMLPAFAKEQNDMDILKRHLSEAIQITSYILTPILLGFFAVAPTFVDVILTNKWADCVPYIQIFCLMYLTRPLSTICHQVLLALNRSGLAMIIGLIINISAVIGLLVSVFVFKKAYFIAWSLLISDIISMILYMFVTNKLLKYSAKEQIIDIMPSILFSAIMMLIVIPIRYIDINRTFVLLVQILIGICVYILLSHISKNRTYITLRRFAISFSVFLIKKFL